jgi:beta-glucosidase/6-phospho-beta-glucosidase/beta-galactosidase
MVSGSLLREFLPLIRTMASAHPSGRTCTKEPWIVGHHIILAHAQACKMYKEEFKPTQKGTIGITLNGDWAEPWDDSPESESSELCRR